MYGCPSVCRYKYDRKVQDMPCEDVDDGHTGLGQYMYSYQNLFHYAPEVKKFVAEKGPQSCSAWTEEAEMLRWSKWSIGPVSVCDPSTAEVVEEHGLRSLRPLCPV